MARPRHFVMKRETAWGTWNLPDVALEVANFAIAVNRARIEERLTGATRMLTRRYMGAKTPSGSLELPVWGEDMGWLIAAGLLHDITSTQPAAVPSPTVYEHAFLPDDDADVASLSVQAQYSGATAINVIGLLLNSFTISCRAGEAARFAAEWIAKDEAKVGGTFEDDTASAAIIASPTYFANTVPYMIFTGASIISGGTPSVDPTSKQYSIAGGTTETTIEGFELTVENNLDARVLLSAPTPGNVVAQDRSINFSFDYVPGEDIGYTWYEAYRNGTQTALQFSLQGTILEDAYYREMIITLPMVDFDEANMPDLAGSKTRLVRAVSGTALQHSSGYDIGITIRDGQASYAAV